jgi:tetratricopeptide (TPR) repeat protein
VSGPRRWGGLARRGAAQVPPTGASDAWRAAARARRDDRGGGSGDDAGAARERPQWEPEEWIDEGELRDEAAGAVERSREGSERAAGRPRRRSQPAPGTAAGTEGRSPGASTPRRRPAGKGAGAAARAGGGRRASTGARTGGGRRATTGAQTGGATGAAPVDDDLGGAVPSGRLPQVAGRLREAGDAFSRGRFDDARRILRPLAEQAPRAASVRELYGLSLYRLGRWAQAARQLEAYRSLTGSAEQNPVLADCYRALGRYAEAEELWDELRAASPRAELVAEGRIVAAGALADQGRLDEAVDVLASAVNRPTRKPQLHHLRMAYALADLYERAGDLPRARELFGRIAASDADFVDVDARLRALK